MPTTLDKQLRQILDAAPDAMVVVDQRACVVAANGETERLFGWTDAELRGEPLSRLIPPRFQRAYDALVAIRTESRAASPGTPPHRAPVSIFARRKNGSEFPVEIHRRPIDPDAGFSRDLPRAPTRPVAC